MYVYSMYHDNAFLETFAEKLNAKIGRSEVRQFPDGETYIRIFDDLKHERVLLVDALFPADSRSLAAVFFARTARALGADSVGLFTPYLPYMRQDKAFHPGEGLTSQYFAQMISETFDWLATVDPHLHRYHSLSEIYSIPTKVLHASSAIAAWIKKHVQDPVLIGPDGESKQWVQEVAEKIGAPYAVFKKNRAGDREVEVISEDETFVLKGTPILLDDIISTARTMIQAVKRIRERHELAPICLGVHALFVEDAYALLKASGCAQVITCDTVQHPSNQIALSSSLQEPFETWLTQIDA